MCAYGGEAEREGEGKREVGGQRSKLGTTHPVFRNKISQNLDLVKKARLSYGIFYMGSGIKPRSSCLQHSLPTAVSISQDSRTVFGWDREKARLAMPHPAWSRWQRTGAHYKASRDLAVDVCKCSQEGAAVCTDPRGQCCQVQTAGNSPLHHLGKQSFQRRI